MEREFKYYREDFGKLPIKVIHMDLDFDVYETYTDVNSALSAEALENIKELELNAQDLEIHEVNCDITKAFYEYKNAENKLIIKFNEEIIKGTKFTIFTKTTLKPTNNVLEGLYYDETPKDAPPQMITQCQQWGFQRIVPCVDDMTAKCTYVTKITADSRYTNIISNGDLVEEKDFGNGKKYLKYDNTKTPMAPYLFFLGVGTYETFKKKVKYATGKEFVLELLVPPKSEPEPANKALQILHDAIQWINIFTGKEKYVDEEKRKKLYELISKRDGEQTEKYDSEIKELSNDLVFGYEYTGTVYREIGMQNSNFGGMENVGNTTITTNRIMPFKDIADGYLEYLFMVKVHEFYHNINGSEVTGWSPFEIWLNEAVTVHIERENSSFLFGEDYHRLEEVNSLLAPGSGTLALDDSPTSMPVEPSGFNHPDELITSITYIKAPEFVRMIQLLMGKENFVLGLHNYHTKYKHSNATSKQWLEEMELVAKTDFSEMAKCWLSKTGFPKIVVKTKFENNNYYIEIEQTNGRWEFPLSVAICDEEGNIINEKIERISEKKQTIIFEDVKKPAFASLNRGYSFYGKIDYKTNEKELWLQARKDKDLIARYLAIRKIINEEKIRLIKNLDAKVDEKIVDLYFSILSNKETMQKVGSGLLPNLGGIDSEEYSEWYEEIFVVKNKLRNAIEKKYSKEILDLYNYYSSMKPSGNFSEKTAKEIKLRQAKNICLNILGSNKEFLDLIKKQYHEANNSTDRISAIRNYLDSSAEDKKELYEQFKDYSKKNLVAWELFLHVIASLENPENIVLLKDAEKDNKFRIEQTNDIRALYTVFSMNKYISLCTAEGRDFLKNSLLKIAKTNEYVTIGTIKHLAKVNQMKPEIGKEAKKIIEELKSSVENNSPIYNNCERILKQINI